MSISLNKLFKGFIAKDGMPTKRMLRVSEEELACMLQSYGESCLRCVTPTNDSAQGFAAYRSSISTSLESPSFLASAVAYSCVYFNDPIASMIKGKPELTFGDKRIDRERLAKGLQRLRILRPLIDEGVLVPLPISNLHETESIPLYYTEDRFRSNLTESVWKFAQDRAVVHPGEVAGDAMVIYLKEIDRPVPLISVSFQNDGQSPGMIFKLGKLWFDKKENRKFSLEIPNDKAAPSRPDFDAWVDQSINQAMLARLRHISKEIKQADQLGAFYCTESSFESELLSLANTSDSKKPAANSANFLLSNRKQLRITDPRAVVKFRSMNQSRIRDFQSSLFAMAQSLRDVDDFEVAAAREFDKTVRPQVESLDQAWGKLKGQIVGDATLAVVGAATMFANGTALPVSAALGAIGGIGKSLPGIGEYLSKRGGIAFLWQMLS